MEELDRDKGKEGRIARGMPLPSPRPYSKGTMHEIFYFANFVPNKPILAKIENS
jgi:hypothetical protein